MPPTDCLAVANPWSFFVSLVPRSKKHAQEPRGWAPSGPSERTGPTRTIHLEQRRPFEDGSEQRGDPLVEVGWTSRLDHCFDMETLSFVERERNARRSKSPREDKSPCGPM